MDTPQIKSETLQKQAYSNILKILTLKNENFHIKILTFFTFLLKTLIVGTQRGSSNEYQQSIFFSRNKKNNLYPCKPKFYYIKVGFKGVKII